MIDSVTKALLSTAKLTRAHSSSDAAEVFREVVAEFGITGYMLIDLLHLEQFNPRTRVLSDLDPAWLDEYFGNKRYDSDPAIGRSRLGPGSFFRSELGQPATCAAEALLADARRNGMADSFIVSSFHPNDVRTVVCLSSPDAIRWDPLEQSVVELAVNAFVGHVLLDRGRRSVAKMEFLSSREQEILSRAAAGKSDKDIARELHLQRSTIQTYWARIRTKLMASNRSNAVALGMLSDQVTLASPC